MKNTNQRLHLGCGGIIFPEWINIDLDHPKADLHLDLTKSFPFSDATVKYIFTEHFIEHITRADALQFLKDCRRILGDEGTIRITTPNLRYLIACYLAGNQQEWGSLWQPPSLCSMMNEGMRAWGHQYLYDANELVNLLIEAGFKNISFQEYKNSKTPELCNLESRPFHYELIVEAKKAEGSDIFIDKSVIDSQEKRFINILNTEVLSRYQSAETALKENRKYAADLERELSDQIIYSNGLAAGLKTLQSTIFGKAAALWLQLNAKLKRK